MRRTGLLAGAVAVALCAAPAAGAEQLSALRGVNRSGTEYACVQGWGFFDGPSDARSLAAIRAWHANAVRVPLNEQCWLGHVKSRRYGGSAYRAAIRAYVARVGHAGMTAILELHWSAGADGTATRQQPMPDARRAPGFWRSVARAFRSSSRVVFELFNEPYPDGNRDTAEAWRCWQHGGRCRGVPFVAAGMQSLVSAVRSAGARQWLLLGGVEYSNALTGWLAHEPRDPLHRLAAAWHVYDFNRCHTPACYTTEVAPVRRRVPVVATEYGPADDCARPHPEFLDALFGFFARERIGNLAWTWDTWDSCLALISDYGGTPTPGWGSRVREHLGGGV